ncbi:HD family phosphohydrolase [Nitrospira sp.]|nr:HD family phosphohydrolase [Nitrospira sp.]
MTSQRISIADLQIGMYVSALDLPWYRSPFLRHSFLVERDSQIDKLIRAGVRTVTIDLVRGLAPDSRNDEAAPSAPAALSSPTPMVKQLKPLAQLTDEYRQAKLAKQQLTQAVKSVFATISKTGTVDTQQAAEAVQEITIVTRTLTHSSLFMALSQNQPGESVLSQHALTTCTLSLVLGQAFQLNPLELQELATAALLHDVGLLQIKPTIRHRIHSLSGLSQAEKSEFETHPTRGVRTLQRQGGFDAPILHLIANHHAYLDESGYPQEARGEFTSDRTRILMVVDRYDELLTGFGGATPLTSHQTFQRLYQEVQKGTLDERVVSTFITLIGIYPIHSQVRLNTQEVAVVTELNQTQLHQPIITITHRPGGKEYPDPFVINLAEQVDADEPRSIETIIQSNN